MEVVTKLVNQLSVDPKQCENYRNQSRKQSTSWGRWGDNRRDRGQQQDRGFRKRRRFPKPGPGHRDRSFRKIEPYKRNYRQGFKCLWTRKTQIEEMSKLFPMWKFPTLKQNCPFKKKTTENKNIVRICSKLQLCV